MTPGALEAEAGRHGLFVMGAAQDGADALILLGANAAMWPIFTASAEFADGAPDPLDRWSKRVIGEMAHHLGAEAIFPSDGPPYAPFIAWALGTGRFWQSPSGMMVHDVAGLMISIRGAVRLAGRQLPSDGASKPPCTDCAWQPCARTCPVDALRAERGYDVEACHAFLRTDDGQDCLTNGCKARRACPVSQSFGRDPAQSAFHMKAFHTQ